MAAGSPRAGRAPAAAGSLHAVHRERRPSRHAGGRLVAARRLGGRRDAARHGGHRGSVPCRGAPPARCCRGGDPRAPGGRRAGASAAARRPEGHHTPCQGRTPTATTRHGEPRRRALPVPWGRAPEGAVPEGAAGRALDVARGRRTPERATVRRVVELQRPDFAGRWLATVILQPSENK